MSILVSSISVPFQKGEAAAIELALRRAGVKKPKSVYIVKSSVDARRRSDIKFVYTVGIECDHEEEILTSELSSGPRIPMCASGNPISRSLSPENGNFPPVRW